MYYVIDIMIQKIITTKKLNIMNILITGALGHIGSYLIRHLPKKIKKSKFYLIDDLRTQRYLSLINLPKNSKFKYYDQSISKI